MMDIQVIEGLLRAHACQQAVLGLYAAIDGDELGAAAARFTDVCQWNRAGKMLRNPADVHFSLAERSSTRVVRHVLTDFLIERVDALSAEARFHLTVYQADSGKLETLPVKGAIAVLITDVRCELSNVNDQWLIRKLEIDRIFY